MEKISRSLTPPSCSAAASSIPGSPDSGVITCPFRGSHLGTTTAKVDFWVGPRRVLAVATSTLANVTLRVEGNASIVESNVTGKYKLELQGNHSHVENSHFGACYGSCVSIRSQQSALVGSSMQTAVSVWAPWGKIGAHHLEIRDVEVFDVYTPFLQYVDKDEGRKLSQRHLKSCQYSLQGLAFTCSGTYCISCSCWLPSDNTFQLAEKNRPTHTKILCRREGRRSWLYERVMQVLRR